MHPSSLSTLLLTCQHLGVTVKQLSNAAIVWPLESILGVANSGILMSAAPQPNNIGGKPLPHVIESIQIVGHVSVKKFYNDPFCWWEEEC